MERDEEYILMDEVELREELCTLKTKLASAASQLEREVISGVKTVVQKSFDRLSNIYLDYVVFADVYLGQNLEDMDTVLEGARSVYHRYMSGWLDKVSKAVNEIQSEIAAGLSTEIHSLTLTKYRDELVGYRDELYPSSSSDDCTSVLEKVRSILSDIECELKLKLKVRKISQAAYKGDLKSSSSLDSHSLTSFTNSLCQSTVLATTPLSTNSPSLTNIIFKGATQQPAGITLSTDTPSSSPGELKVFTCTEDTNLGEL